MDLKHDDRLKLLTNGKYEIWHDSQKIGVPYGESTTQPKQRDLISCNTSVYGEIRKGFFQKPCVDFTNTQVNVERFDKFCLKIMRSGDDLPIDEEIDLPDDLGIEKILCSLEIQFSLYDYKGFFSNVVILNHLFDNIWISDILHFDNFCDQNLQGDFFLCVNPTQFQLSQGTLFDISQTIKDGMTACGVIKRATIENGISKMSLLLKNTENQIQVDVFNLKC